MPTKTAAASATLTVKLVKSLIGSTKTQIATANSLGLRRIGDTNSQPDNAQTRGQVKKISHLVEMTEGK